MKKLLLILLLVASPAFAGQVVYLYDGAGNPIGSTAGALNVTGAGGGGSNAAAGLTGAAVPTSASYTGVKNGSGNLVGLSLGQQTMANSLGCALASDQSAIPVTESGTWNITNVSGTVSLPTGASTAAKQPALGTAGTASSDVITVQGIASMTALKVDGSAVTQPISASSLPLPAGASTAAKQPALGTAGTPSADVITIQGATSMTALTVKPSISVTGSGSSAAATVSTVITLTAPSNAVGFILMNLDVSTANVRWAVGRTASTTLGQQLQPGRDTGFVPIGANISLIAESGTQTYDVQWVAQ